MANTDPFRSMGAIFDNAFNAADNAIKNVQSQVGSVQNHCHPIDRADYVWPYWYKRDTQWPWYVQETTPGNPDDFATIKEAREAGKKAGEAAKAIRDAVNGRESKKKAYEEAYEKALNPENKEDK